MLVVGNLLLIIGVFKWTDSCTAVAIPSEEVPEEPDFYTFLNAPCCVR